MPGLLFRLPPGVMWECETCLRTGEAPHSEDPTALVDLWHYCDRPLVVELLSDGRRRAPIHGESLDPPSPAHTQAPPFLTKVVEMMVKKEEIYGPPSRNITAIAAVWSTLFSAQITPRQVVLAMIATKLVRETNKPKHDNRLDIAGYICILEDLMQKEKI